MAVPGIELGDHAGVKRDWPGVVEAMELVGSTQVQGRATLVGNLCNGSPAADSVPALVAAGRDRHGDRTERHRARWRSTRFPPGRARPC